MHIAFEFDCFLYKTLKLIKASEMCDEQTSFRDQVFIVLNSPKKAVYLPFRKFLFSVAQMFQKRLKAVPQQMKFFSDFQNMST